MENKKPLQGTILEKCEACGRLFIRGIETPDGSDLLCDECRKTYMDCAKLFCMTCNRIVGRVAPTVTEDGFYVKPRMILHVRHCPACDTFGESSTIIEIEEYLRKKYPHDLWDGKKS